MKPHKRGNVYCVDIRRRGFPRIQLSTGTRNKVHATAMAHTLVSLMDAGRTDPVGLLAANKLSLGELHEAYLQRARELGVGGQRDSSIRVFGAGRARYMRSSPPALPNLVNNRRIK